MFLSAVGADLLVDMFLGEGSFAALMAFDVLASLDIADGERGLSLRWLGLDFHFPNLSVPVPRLGIVEW